MNNNQPTDRQQHCTRGCCTPGRLVWSDPGFKSTPELWECAQCGRETRWLRRRDRFIFIEIAPPARDYQPDRLIHSRITHANRKRALANLPPDIERIVRAFER